MTIKRIIYLSIVTVVIVLAYFGWRLTARSAYESAEYTVLESDSPFETDNWRLSACAPPERSISADREPALARKLFSELPRREKADTD
jgi:hypothetical protein